MRSAITLVLLLVGCDCPDGVCTDPDETQHFAGPCRSARPGFICDYAYDEQQRMTEVACMYQSSEDPRWRIDYTTTWTYEGDDLREVRWTKVDHLEGIGDNGAIWYFSDDKVTAAYGSNETTPVATFDRTMFAFDPAIGSDLALPLAELGLVEFRSTTFAWTRDGNRLTRVQHGGYPDGEVNTYDFDERGRLIMTTSPRNVIAYTYEDDRLVKRQHWLDGSTFSLETYEYDRGGNLLASGNERYDYRCWQ